MAEQSDSWLNEKQSGFIGKWNVWGVVLSRSEIIGHRTVLFKDKNCINKHSRRWIWQIENKYKKM